MRRAIAILVILVAAPADAGTCTTTSFLADPTCTPFSARPKQKKPGTGTPSDATTVLLSSEANNLEGGLITLRTDSQTKASQIASQSSAITSLQSTIATMQGQLAQLYSASAPTCSSFTPTSGPVGTSLTVTGTNLIAANGLTIGGAASAPVPSSNTSLVAIVPAQAATGSVVVYAPGGSVTCSGTFTVTGTTGSITSVTVAAASVQTNQSTQMVATVTSSGTISQAVTWSATGGGTINATTGVFTAGASAGTATVTATSVADATKSGSATVTITSSAGPTYYVSHSGTDGAAGTISAPWRTLAYAVNHVAAGATLYIRGGPAGSDDNTACTAEGGKNGACWRETEAGCYIAGYSCSPLTWTRSHYRPAGTSGNPITFACYPGEVCIIEPSTGFSVIGMEPFVSGGAANPAGCSYLTFKDLILDGRNTTTNVIKVDPATGAGDATSTMCGYNQITGTSCTGTFGAGTRACTAKIRHGWNVAGLSAFGTHWTLTNVEFYENGGNQGGAGDHDHSIYYQGDYLTMIGGRIHHNIQGVQLWNGSMTTDGYSSFAGVEIDNNGVNTWTAPGTPNACSANIRTRCGSDGDLMVFQRPGSSVSMTGNAIHHNTHNAISLGAPWGSAPTGGADTVQNNYLFSNTDQTSSTCGPSIYVAAAATAPICSGNTATSP